MPRHAALAASIALAVASVAMGQDLDPRIDRDTGRAKLNFPHDRHFDHLHLRLDLDIPTMAKAELDGVETLSLAAIGTPRSQVVLDSRGPQVSSVTMAGQELKFTLADERLVIALPAPAEVGVPLELVIRYHLDFSKNKGEGLTWSRPIPNADSLTRSSPQIHAQGEAEVNSRWFPCHDFPNEKLTTEIIITLEDGFDVVSNGRLLSQDEVPSAEGAGRRRWHWLQDKPHSSYLVTLAIAKFAVVDVSGPDSARPGLPMPVYVPWGTENNVSDNFGNTPAMIAFFEKRFDEPYPWDQYAQVMVRDFAAGGMENTSCTLLTVGTANAGPPGSKDDLISHELAHQWFGDLVTCASWEHLWLNEGWASYCECLWNEHKAATMGERASESRGRDAYLKTVIGYVRQQRIRNKGSNPGTTPMVSKRYENPDAVFSKPDDPYSKGAVVLHMLRERLGDDAFFAGVRAYLDKYKFRNAETEDFRRELEAASGQSLERFFAQWVYRAGVPRLATEFDWDQSTSKLTVHVEQTQTIDHLNPAFAFVLPLLAKFDDGTTRWLELRVDSHEADGVFELPGKPSHVSVDPNLEVMAAVETRKPLAMWIDELRHGTTITARMTAAEALAEAVDPGAWEALEWVATLDDDEDLRRAAAKSLAAARAVHARAEIQAPAGGILAAGGSKGIDR